MLYHPNILHGIQHVIAWTNGNEGVLSLLIFLLSILFAWATGIISSLRRKPKFKIGLLPGPTFCSTFLTEEKYEGQDVHRSAFALYLRISNVGSAASSIERVSIGYHWHLRPFSVLWMRYSLFWFWLHDQILTAEDFQYHFADKMKIYPSLFQKSAVSGHSAETFLQIGQSTNGVVYFEEKEKIGGAFPSPRKGQARVRVGVSDSFGKKHKRSFWLPIVSLDEARKYNPSFGATFPAIRSEPVRPNR